MHRSKDRPSPRFGKFPDGKRGVTIGIVFGLIILVLVLEAVGVISEQEFCIIALALLILAVWWHSR